MNQHQSPASNDNNRGIEVQEFVDSVNALEGAVHAYFSALNINYQGTHSSMFGYGPEDSAGIEERQAEIRFEGSLPDSEDRIEILEARCIGEEESFALDVTVYFDESTENALDLFVVRPSLDNDYVRGGSEKAFICQRTNTTATDITGPEVGFSNDTSETRRAIQLFKQYATTINATTEKELQEMLERRSGKLTE